MRVAFAADHAGVAFKDELIHRLVVALGGQHELTDLGGDGSDPNDDYPDFAQAVGEAVRDGRADRGILICGSGVGASVAANKIPGIRAAICHDTYSAHQGVEHDDMNVLTLGARVIGIEPAVECSLAFLAATFSGEERHQRRLDKVLAIEAAGREGIAAVQAHPIPVEDPRPRLRVPRELLVVVLGSLAVLAVLLVPDLMPPPDDTAPPVVALHGRIVSVALPDTTSVDAGGPPVPTAKVEIVEGERQGEILDAQIEGPGGSQLIGDYKPGDEVVVSITRSEDESSPYIAVADRWRVVPLGLLVGLFALAVVAVGGWRGARALVALGLTIAIILKILLPLMIRGVPPLPLAVVSAAGITAVTILLTEGRSRASLAAILGTSAALALAGLLAAAATAAASFTYSAGSDLAFLVTLSGSGLDLRGVLLAAMLLGAVGVLDDVTVTQAVVVEELASRSSLRGRALFMSAHAIGRSHIGATVNTLFLAYVGAALPLLIVLLVSHPPLALVYNSEDIATEIVRTLAGSLGIVAAVPLTTFIATTLVGHGERTRSGEPAGDGPARRSLTVAGVAALVMLLLGASAILPATQGSRAPLPTEAPFQAPPGDGGFGAGETPPSDYVIPTDSPDAREPELADIGYPVPIDIGTQTVGTATVAQASVTGRGKHRVEVVVAYEAISTWPLDPQVWEILTSDGTEIPLVPSPPMTGSLQAGDDATFTLSAATSKSLRDAFVAYRDTPETFAFLVALP